MKYRIKQFIATNKSFTFKWLDRISLAYIDCRANLSYDINTNGERRLLSAIQSLNFKIYFDVGANSGEWSLLVHSLNNENSIHAFELIPSTFQLLKNNTRYLSNVFCNNFGLSDSAATVTACYSEDDNKLSSMIAGKEIHALRWQEIDCNVLTGDEYCNNKSINFIDFLKIDTEGSDLKVLRGFMNKLNGGNIRLIQFEYGMTNIYSRDLLLDFYDLLQSKGYVIGKIYPDGVRFNSYNPRHEDFRGPNYVAVRSEDKVLIDAVTCF